MILNWFPELSHFENVDGLAFFITTEGRFGVLFRLPILDLDERKAVYSLETLSQISLFLPKGALLRLRLKNDEKRQLPFDSIRSSVIAFQGYRTEECILSIEGSLPNQSIATFLKGFISKKTDQNTLKRALHLFAQSLPLSQLKGLGAFPLNELESRSALDLGCSEISKESLSLRQGSENVGVLRIWKQGAFDLDEQTLALIKQQLPSPFEISVTIKHLDRTHTHYLLKKELGAALESSDPLAHRKSAETQVAMEESLMGGDGLVRVEWLAVFRHPNIEKLHLNLKDAIETLTPLGEVVEETVGCFGSFRAMQFGAEQHHTFLERSSAAWAYLPVGSHGSGSSFKKPGAAKNNGYCVTKSLLTLHREDNSLCLINPFDSSYGGFNCITNGIKGSGKSVLNNLLSRALLEDPSVRMYKIDVGGSYRKECALQKGIQFEINMSEPSGINPFSVLRELPGSPDVIETLSKLLCSLILETGERFIPKMMEAEIEKILLRYSATHPEHPSLANFSEYANSDFPRKALLDRWGHGIYHNVLKAREQPIDWENGRYFYFNFDQIKDASSGDYAKGIIGSVIALVNMEMLRAGDAMKAETKRRLILFVDEAPFFVQQHAKFFKLTTANFRKYGHGTVLIAQSLNSFEFIGENGLIDRGIISNSPIRFLFEIEGDDEEFMSRYDITKPQLDRMKRLYRGRGYRECLFQSPGTQKALEGKVLRIFTDPKEYWEVTSDDKDNERLFGLMRNVPGLTLEEAIQCLSMSNVE